MEDRIGEVLARTLQIYMSIHEYIDKEKDIVDVYPLDEPTIELGSVVIYEYEKEIDDGLITYQCTEDDTYEHLCFVNWEYPTAVFGVQRIGSGMEVYVVNSKGQKVVLLEIRLPGQLTDIKGISEYVKNVLEKGRLYVVH